MQYASSQQTASPDRSAIPSTRPQVIALVGNPNTGKTSLFNALTGFRRHVANYPGVTVDAARGPLRGAPGKVELLDLPGTYSLAAVSPDEQVVTDVLCGSTAAPTPDAILAIVDASNLPRNLYLVTQLLDVGAPVVVALNMVDVARARGLEIDAERLADRLGVPVVQVVATRPASIHPLAAALQTALNAGPPPQRTPLPEPLVREVARVREGLPGLRFAEAIRALADPSGQPGASYRAQGGDGDLLEQARARLAAEQIDPHRAEVQARYAWIQRLLDGVIARKVGEVRTWSDRLDLVLTHRIGGFLVLFAVLFVLFQSIFTWAGPLMERIEGAFGWLAGAVAPVLPAGVLRSLVTDGLIAGVGGVLVFLPQILILFAFIAILEDCGYMARAAYMMDRVMRSLGLSGRAFIPLLSSFACAVPAIMGTRAIADRRERFVTIMIAPFMSCSARLPVYVLLIAAFVPATSYLGGWVGLQGLVMFAMYLVGVVFAVPLAWLLKRTAFAGPSSGFLLELPSYKWPRLRAIWQRMFFAGRGFIVRAGTIILLVNLVVWALGYFPRSDATRLAVERIAVERGWDAERTESALAGAYLRDSYLARMGKAVEPLFEPIGWDWRISMAVLASFPAREVVIATLGTIYNLGDETDETSAPLREAMKQSTWPGSDRPVFTLPVALSLMVFFALCAQCSSTLVVMGREMNSVLWPVASFFGMTLLAYFAAWGTAAVARTIGLAAVG